MQKIVEFLYKTVERIFPKVTIFVDGEPYLTRIYLLGRDWKFANLYLHHFHKSDQINQLHNHPWSWGLSLILLGGYVEEKMTGVHGIISTATKLPLCLNVVKNSDFHRVSLIDQKNGAWTLFLTGNRSSEWGFVDRFERKFIHWTTNPDAIE